MGGRGFDLPPAASEPFEVLIPNVDITDTAGFSARLRSDPALAIRVPDAEQYWEGVVPIPLIVDGAVIRK